MEQIKSEELYLELKREKEVLEKIVNVINLFVEKYKDAKEVFSQFNLDYIDFSVENIKKIIDELENKVNHYNEVVEPEYKKLNDNMQVLYDKFTEILEKQEEYQKFIFEMNRAKEIINTTENKELQNKSYLFDEITNYNEYYSEEKYNKLKSKFTCKQLTELKLHHLDNNYCIFLASKYFNSINDFKNIEITCQRLNGTTDKFHFNLLYLSSE